MADTLQIRCKIGGTDYGQAGQNILLPGFRLTAGNLQRIGDADLPLEGASGYDADIRNQQYVELYLYNVTQNRVPARGKLFAGWVAARETGQNPGTLEKVWHLPCQDLNLLWDTLVAKAAWTQGIHLAADTFAAQIAALFAVFATGAATHSVDAGTHVLNLTGSVVLPPVDFTGPDLRDMIGVIFANARKVNPLLRPTASITPDPTIGGVGDDSFGSPVLWVWDLASPPSPTIYYTTGTPDLVTHFPILPDQPVFRRLESPRFANWGQAIDAAGQVYTSSDTTSQGIYPGNPYDPDGVWKRAAYRDTQNTGPVANATGTASVAGGAVTGVAMGLNGSGYPQAPSVVFTGGGGSGAAAQANMGGAVRLVTVTNQGSGYTSAPGVGFSGGGGSGATATATLDGSGHVTAITITNGGTGYTSAPTVAFSGGGGSGAAATATIGGSVLSVTMLAGGTGYASAPTVTFADAVQQALDGQVARVSEAREVIPILVDTPTLPGTYAGLTLSVEAGIVDTPYLVDTLTADFTHPTRPLYLLECGARRRRIGETDADDVYAPPILGARLNAPGNFAETNAFDPYVGNTLVTYTFTAPTPPPGVQIDHYDLHVYVDSRWWVTRFPGMAPGQVQNAVNPGSAIQAYLVAVGSDGRESWPTPTLSFTAAAAYSPDAPHSLTLGNWGINPDNGKGWALIGFTAGGTTHGPHDRYEVHISGGGHTYDQQFLGTVGDWYIDGLTSGVTYSVSARAMSLPGWYGPYNTDPPLSESPLSVPILPRGGPAPTAGGGAPQVDALLWPFLQTAGTGTVITDGSDPYDGADAYKLVSTGTDTQTLTGVRFATQAGQVWVVRQASKKSGGSPTVTGSVEWDDGSDTWALTASTLTITAPTTTWPAGYTEQQVTAPSGAKFGRLKYSVAFAAALTVLLSAPAPTQAQTPSNLYLGTSGAQPIIIRDQTDGSAQASLYAAGSANLIIEGANSGRAILDFRTYGAATELQLNDSGTSLMQVSNTNIQLTTSGTGKTLIVGKAEVQSGPLSLDRPPTLPWRSITGTYTLAQTDYGARLSGGSNYTVTLPAANSVPEGRGYLLIRTSAAGLTTYTVAAAGSDTIEGAATKTLTAQYQKLWLISDGSATWFSLAV